MMLVSFCPFVHLFSNFFCPVVSPCTPKDATELRKLSEYYDYCTDRRSVLHSRIKYELKGLVTVLMSLDHVFHVKHQIQISNAWSWPKKSSYFFRKNQKIIKDKRNEMASELSRLIKMHERDMRALESDVKGMRRSGTLKKEHRVVMQNKLTTCKTNLTKLDSSSHEINKLENILNPAQKVTDYHKRLKVVNSLLIPYNEVWHYVEEYYRCIDLWRQEDLNSMNSKTILQELQHIKTKFKMGRIFLRKQNGTTPLQAVDTLLNELSDFEENEASLISLFATEALQQRHWDAISVATDMKDLRKRDRRRSVAHLMEVGLLEQVPKVEEIVINAKKEMSATIMLNEMKDIWSAMYFTVVSSNADATVAGTDDDPSVMLFDENNTMRSLLDEHLTKTDMMKGN